MVGKMVEEDQNNILIKFIASSPENLDNVKKKWRSGSLKITDSEIEFSDDNETIKIPFSEITDVGKKVNLGKLALGAAIVLSIHHTSNGQKLVSLISTKKDTANSLKKTLCEKIPNNSDIEFVCPFSKGGKVLLDKQPVKGKMQIHDNKLELISEWMGKKQVESIEISNIDDFDIGDENDVSEGIRSLILKYQKKGEGVISTLINGKNSDILLLNKLIMSIKGIEEDEEDIELTEEEFMLVQMMYTSDIEADSAIEMLGIDLEKLQNIVKNLVSKKVLQVSGDDEFELTEIGTKYIVAQMKKNIGGLKKQKK